ncbi:hypothetical protein ACTA71_009400 [Dictyostelium dimigraforme]
MDVVRINQRYQSYQRNSGEDVNNKFITDYPNQLEGIINYEEFLGIIKKLNKYNQFKKRFLFFILFFFGGFGMMVGGIIMTVESHSKVQSKKVTFDFSSSPNTKESEPSNNDTLGIVLIVIGGIIFFIGLIMLACSYTISSSIYKGNINNELSIVNENFKPKGIVWELETESVNYRKRYTIKINIPRSIRQNLGAISQPQPQSQPQINIQPNIINNNTIANPYYYSPHLQQPPQLQQPQEQHHTSNPKHSVPYSNFSGEKSSSKQKHIVPYSDYSGEQSSSSSSSSSNPTTTYSPQPKPSAPPTDYHQYYPPSQQESIPKPYVPNSQYSGESTTTTNYTPTPQQQQPQMPYNQYYYGQPSNTKNNNNYLHYDNKNNNNDDEDDAQSVPLPQEIMDMLELEEKNKNGKNI